MPFHNIARTHTERKQVREFWEDMRKEAEKIHKDFYKKIYKSEKLKDRPDFFEPLNSNN